MYLNSVLLRLEKTESDAGMGYNTIVLTETQDKYNVDKQPYSAPLAKKQYGLADEGVMYRCFTEKKGLKKGDYVSCNGEYLIALLVNDWENHSEVILGVFKDG